MAQLADGFEKVFSNLEQLVPLARQAAAEIDSSAGAD